jgi:acyl-CoA synthetase (AMP-forming)/AMP-acid ligase II
MKPIDAQTIPQLIAAAADTFGAKTAIEDGDVTISFIELRDRGLDAARAFIASGLEHGDRVGIWAPNLHEWIIAAIGLQMVGGVLVPLNTRMKGGEAGYILEKSGARMLFTMEEFLGARYIDLLVGAMGQGTDSFVSRRHR